MSIQSPIDPGQTTATPAAKTSAGKGLGIAALVIAILALCLCWVPIINNFAAVLGFVALILGIISLVIAAKRNGSKGMGVASSIIAVVAIVLVFVTQAAYVAAIDEVVEAIEEGVDGQSEASESEIAQASDESMVLNMGDSIDIGEYAVSVTSVNLEAAAEIEAANPFNESANGQYVLVELEVTYNGNEEGDPWIDLVIELMGSDARIYSSSTTDAIVENSAFDLPTLTTGGSGSFQVVFDVPAEAVTDAKVRVTETLSFTDDAGIWAAK